MLFSLKLELKQLQSHILDFTVLQIFTLYLNIPQ